MTGWAFWAVASLSILAADGMPQKSSKPHVLPQARHQHLQCAPRFPGLFRTCEGHWNPEQGFEICTANATSKGGGNKIYGDRRIVSLTVFGTDYYLIGDVDYTVVPVGLPTSDRTDSGCFDHELGEKNYSRQ